MLWTSRPPMRDTGEALQVEFDICVEAAAVECKAVEVLKGVAVESVEPDLLGKVAEEVEVRDQLEKVCDGMQISVKTLLGKSIALDVEAADGAEFLLGEALRDGM